MPKRSTELNRDREFLFYHAKKFAAVDNRASSVSTLQVEVANKLRSAKSLKDSINGALEKLEEVRDARRGIAWHVAAKGKHGEAPVVIRDRRKIVRGFKGCESYIMQFLNAVSAAQEVLEIEGINNTELEGQLRSRAEQFFHQFKDFPSHGMHDRVQKELKSLVKLLANQGVEDAGRKVDLAIDFQSFNRPHHNVATISQVKKGAEVFTVIEAEVAATKLSSAQEQQFEALETNPKIWRFERQLMKRHKGAILDGRHVIPSRKHSLPGTPFFEKTTLLAKGSAAFEEVLLTPNCASVAAVCDDESLRDKMTAQNLAQARTFYPESDLHFNLLNAKNPRPGSVDREIVNRTMKAVKNFTVSCANAFRRFSSANDVSGVQRYLGDLAQSIDPQKIGNKQTHPAKATKVLQQLKDYLAPPPKGFFAGLKHKAGKMFAPSGKQILKDLKKNISFGDGRTAVLEMAASAISLKKKAARLSSFRFRDPENASLDVSAGLNELGRKIEAVKSAATEVGIEKTKLPRDLPVVCCHRGRDRTRIATHDQTARIIAEKTGIELKEVDAALSEASSAEFMAGSCMVGVGAAGHFGIRRNNEGVLPESRKENLSQLLSKETRRYDLAESVVKKAVQRRKPAPQPVVNHGPAITHFSATQMGGGRVVTARRP